METSQSPDSRKKPGFWKRLSVSRFFLISLGVHFLIGIIATVLVVQTITAKRKVTFKGGPPSPNPSQRAMEHRVQMAKKQQATSAPVQQRRVTTNALSKVMLPEMPALPALEPVTPSKMAGTGGTGIGPTGGMGGGNGGDGGGMTMFGMRGSGKGLKGTFYDLKQNRNKKPSGIAIPEYVKVLESFVRNGWNKSRFSTYFKGPTPLYATQLMIPEMDANKGPEAFNLKNEVQPRMWVIHYKGTVIPSETGTFYFVGQGDDILMVRFAGRLVLDANWHGAKVAQDREVHLGWKPTARYDYKWTKNSPQLFPKGEAMQVKAGQPYEMEMLVGEQPGGHMHAVLLLEKEGETYQKTATGAPILPAFRLNRAKPPPLQRGENLPPYNPDGPVWSVMDETKKDLP